jgi:hypothetical protein
MASRMRTPKGQHGAGTFTSRPKLHRAAVARALPFAAVQPRPPTSAAARSTTPGGALAR